MTAENGNGRRWQKLTVSLTGMVFLFAGLCIGPEGGLFSTFCYSITGICGLFVTGNAVSKFAKGGSNNGG